MNWLNWLYIDFVIEWLWVQTWALKVFWVDLRKASSALGEGQSWTSGGTREVLVLQN